MAVFEIEFGFDVEVFGQRGGPEFAFDIKDYFIAFHAGADFEAVADNARLESVESLSQLLLDSAHVGGEDAEEVLDPEVNYGPMGLREIFQAESVLAFLREMGAGAEKPLQIAQNALAVTLKRDDALGAALLGVFWLVVAEAVEEAGLEFFDDD
jgi:hypothetical protein